MPHLNGLHLKNSAKMLHVTHERLTPFASLTGIEA